MEILNYAPLGASGATQYATGSAAMAMSCQGNGLAVRRGHASGAMAMSVRGYAILPFTSHASASMRMTVHFGYPQPKIIPAGFVSNMAARRLLIGMQRRMLEIASENRRLVIPHDPQLTIAPDASRSL